MTVLQEIFRWSQKNLAPWQQDAVGRLYANRTTLTADIEDAYALAKSEHGIEDPAKRVPIALAVGQVAAPAVPNRLVQLLAIKDLSHVNALADGMRLPIIPKGLTVIYGENGAGKSGYSRILKRACRARDQRESILPDARQVPAKVGPPSAVFEALIDGQPCDLAWSMEMKEAPEALSEIAIFDAHCARAYIDNQGDFAYVPYGLDILAGLVSICNSVKEKANAEKRNNAPNTQVFAALAQTTTEVGKVLKAIPGATKAADIEKLAVMTDTEIERLITLAKTLAETDPKQKAAALRLRAKRFSELSLRIGTAMGLVSEDNVLKLRKLVDASNAAKSAADLAAVRFKQQPGLLPGTGGEEWKALFEAARTFAGISHAAHVFPSLPADSCCPLCQNTLRQDGVDRLGLFDEFIGQAAERAAKDTRQAAADAYRQFKAALPGIQLDDALRQELSEAASHMPEEIGAMHKALSERHSQVLEACSGNRDWAAVATLSADTRIAIAILIETFEGEAKVLEAVMDERTKSALAAEHTELDARKKLGEFKAIVLEAIAKHDLSSKLQACIDSISTAGISRQSTELSKTMATQEVADALNAELHSLKVHELQVVMRPESPGGKTQFKLALQLPGGHPPAAILSEGEQRAISIAAFLTEVKLGRGRGGVVFDDPVSSLDHHRRWEVAHRLAVESHSRQVIVFTHDIYFLGVLQQKAKEVGAELKTQYICRTSAGFGVHSENLPFGTLNTKARIGSLRQMQVEVRKAHKNGDMDETKRLTRDTYHHLRLAWERAVEEVLFDGVIQRFGEGVSTQKLRRVTVEDQDYAEINAGMTKSSKFEHDAAATINLPTPHPDEVEADIDKLDAWRVNVEARKNTTAAKRS
jgi:hypothetical protein